MLKLFWRIIRNLLLGLVAGGVLLAGLFFYFIDAPAIAQPALQGKLSEAVLLHDALQRKYTSYVPKNLAPGSPLLLVMHGSGESAADIRKGTGYGFERLADRYGFAVVYPESYTFDWNDCSSIGQFRINGKEVDDLGFLDALVTRLAEEYGSDPRRVFATGVSAGGSMSIRLGLEAPERFRAVAPVAASVPRADNFKCKPAGQGTSVMIMNGSKDPLVPFNGGEVNLLGMFYKAGYVQSSHDSAAFFARHNGIASAPVTTRSSMPDGVAIEELRWSKDGTDVVLAAIHGGGHSLPHPYGRQMRLLGPSPASIDGPAMIWAFFARQPPR